MSNAKARSGLRRQRLPNGTTVDNRYAILGVLGEGGFATVYRAIDEIEGKEVALKVLLASDLAIGDFEFGEFEMRFIREAKAGSSIDHPNIAPIFGSGFAGGKLYIAMELYEGHTLEQELEKNGAMDPARALELFVPVVQGLGYAHLAGVIHRDLKPSNLFLHAPGTDDERMVVLDFGVARLDDGDVYGKLTTPGQVLGTPNYTAPEALKHDESTPSGDVYSLALIFVEMVSGQKVVHGESIYATMALHVSGDFKVPVWLFETPLGAVLNRALAPEPANRYVDADSFHRAIKPLANRRVPVKDPDARLSIAQLRDSGRIPPLPRSAENSASSSSSNPAVKAPPPGFGRTSNPNMANPWADPNMAAMSAAMSMQALQAHAAAQAQDQQGMSMGAIIFTILAVIAALGVLGAVVWFGFLNA